MTTTTAFACAAQSPTPASGPASAASRPSSSSAKPEPADTILAKWPGPNGGVPPWDKVDAALFEPAMKKGAALMLAEIDAIANNTEPPTFDNTLAALERAGKPLGRAATLFFVMSSNRNTPEIQKLSAVIRPMVAKVSDQVNFNSKLFERVKAIYDRRNEGALKPEQIRLVEQSYEGFVRRGAALDADKKKRLGEINQELAGLFTKFGNRVLADEDTWVVFGKKDLAGLPASLVSTYKAAADKRKVEGYAVVNTRSAVEPFLTFSDNRSAREKVWRAFVTRGDHGDKNDTKALITSILQRRTERAKLLGYKNHAEWRMGNTMAKQPERAMDLMMRVWPAAVKKVKNEVVAMRRVAKKGRNFKIEPWDYRYYMEKVRKQKYALDQNEFKNYFELNNMIEASYFMADKLYGFAFEEITGQLPVFHDDVRVYHVTKKADGSHVGYLYRDDFARQYKRSGAWQATYQGQQKLDAKVHPIVSNNNNFNKGAEGQPVLISLDDATTLFHEFGHALHALSNDTTYPSLAGTPRDFVEFPSQVHENWLLTREVLDKYARHYKTGEKMPQSLIDKMRAAATYNQGPTVEYLSAAIVMMLQQQQLSKRKARRDRHASRSAHQLIGRLADYSTLIS